MKLLSTAPGNCRAKRSRQPTTASVPGSVYGDLLHPDVIPDPFDQDNEAEVREWMRHDYRPTERLLSSFEKEVGAKLRRPCFRRTSTRCRASIWTATRSPTTDNMHRTYRFDVAEPFDQRHVTRCAWSCIRVSNYIKRKRRGMCPIPSVQP
ncbi:MAG: hypothetical protein MZU97_19955 [Bacillus subtilis]|nr:hypothetical protein [Bacillus subtilis]